METNILVPQKINVGYQKRPYTYTGQLGFVTYFDNKDQLRKEKSWNGWRNKDLGNNIYENKPLSGFMLNKKVGGYGYGWNQRQTYTRVYDPRGFEFEITIENLLYILGNTSCIIGKGFEGEFVYGWANGQLLLIPTKSPDYAKMLEFTENVNADKIKPKDLIKGATYINKLNKEIVYLGRYPEYSRYYEIKKESISWRLGILRDNKIDPQPIIHKSKLRFWFCERDTGIIRVMATLSQIINLKDPHIVPEYSLMVDSLQCNERFSPIVDIQYLPIDIDYILKQLSAGKNCYMQIYCGEDHNGLSIFRSSDKYFMRKYHDNNVLNVSDEREGEYFDREMSLESLFELLDRPTIKIEYLENGKIKDEAKYYGNK